MMGELKHVRILSLKYLIIASLFLEYKKFCKALVGVPMKFLIIQNEKDMGLELKRVLEFSFFKVFEAKYHSSSSCVFCIAPLFFMLTIFF
jgi:hypothetical protein